MLKRGNIIKEVKIINIDEINCSELIVDKINKRIKLFGLDDIDSISASVEQIVKIANEAGADKILLFQGEQQTLPALFEQGFVEEGKIEGFFSGNDATVLAKYLSEERKITTKTKEEDEIIHTIKSSQPNKEIGQLPAGYSLRVATKDDVHQIISVFKQVFASYPTPMNNLNYVKNALDTNVDMALIEVDNSIVGLCSAEIDYARKSVEITDCATLPSQRGKGIMNHLIRYLEGHLKDIGILNLYSIARASSFGMNKVLYNLEYNYRGRLINNAHISGNWEDMNIWTKQI